MIPKIISNQIPECLVKLTLLNIFCKRPSNLLIQAALHKDILTQRARCVEPHLERIADCGKTVGVDIRKFKTQSGVIEKQREEAGSLTGLTSCVRLAANGQAGSVRLAALASG